MKRQVMQAVVRAVIRPILGPKVPVRFQRRALDLAGRVAVLPDGIERSRVVLGARQAEKLVVPGSGADAAILYLHGGGYTVGSPVTHRALAAWIAESAGVPVFNLDYRLAPENPYPAALNDAVAAYESLVNRGLRVAVAGDSAGGGLALALVQTLRERDLPRPAGLALISPWVDARLVNVRDDHRDPLLRLNWLQSCASRYAGDLDDPKVSPILADLDQLSPTLIQAAEHEIFRPDIERFVARTDADFQLLDGLWHVANLHAGLVPEATHATRHVGRFLKNQLDIVEKELAL